MGKHSPETPGRRSSDKYPPAYINCPRCGKQITNSITAKNIHKMNGTCKK